MPKFILAMFAKWASKPMSNHPLVLAVVVLLAMIIFTQPGERTIFEFTRELIELNGLPQAQ